MRGLECLTLPQPRGEWICFHLITNVPAVLSSFYKVMSDAKLRVKMEMMGGGEITTGECTFQNEQDV